MSTQTLSAAGLELPLVSTADGPRMDDEGEFEGLAVLVNGFLNGLLPDLRERLREGDGAGRGGVYASGLLDGLDPDREGATWRRLTGEPLGDDPVITGSTETGSFTLPRAALMEILDRMLDLRATVAEHAEAPAPPADEASSDPSPVDEAQAMLARAVAARPGAPGRAEELARMERRASELDAMDDPSEASARRRAVLIELDGLRVLSGAEEVGRELRDLGLPTLSGYHAAASRLLAYLDSDDRRMLIPGAQPGPALGAPVSLDWFRRSPTEGFDEAALGEWLLAAAAPEDTIEGRFFTQSRGRWYELRWRRDDGETPALLELKPA